MFYLFDEVGFYYGRFASMEDAIAEMESYGEYQDGMFITTQENPWE